MSGGRFRISQMHGLQTLGLPDAAAVCTNTSAEIVVFVRGESHVESANLPEVRREHRHTTTIHGLSRPVTTVPMESITRKFEPVSIRRRHDRASNDLCRRFAKNGKHLIAEVRANDAVTVNKGEVRRVRKHTCTGVPNRCNRLLITPDNRRAVGKSLERVGATVGAVVIDQHEGGGRAVLDCRRERLYAPAKNVILSLHRDHDDQARACDLLAHRSVLCTCLDHPAVEGLMHCGVTKRARRFLVSILTRTFDPLICSE